MNVLVEYVFDKDEIEILCAFCESMLEGVDVPEAKLAVMHLLEPLQVSREVMSYGDERKG